MITYLLNRLGQLKLSLQGWLVTCGSLALTMLLIVLDYKNKKIHRLQLDLLNTQYATKLEAFRKNSAETKARATKALGEYQKSYNRYIETKE